MGWALTILVAYLLGSISFGIIITKMVKGVDIRNYGSGSTGMTNVLRTVGKGPGALVLCGDALKGAVAVGVGFYFGGVAYGVIGGLAAMLGHAYPIYFGFKGGKGVATGFGIILALAPDVTAIAITIFLVTVLISRYVSLGSLLGSLSVPINMVLFAKPLPLIIFGIVGASFVVYAHRANIKRLYQGKENKVGSSSQNRRERE